MAIKRAKKTPKTKEQVIAELKKNAAFMDKMKFVKERLYPALLDAATSIEDAEMLLQGFNNQIMDKFLGQMKMKTTKELDLASGLDTSSELYPKYKLLVELFDDMSVYDCKDYVEGLRNEIALWKSEEMRERPLSSLKAKFLDDI